MNGGADTASRHAHPRKLTSQQVEAIRKARADGRRVAAIAAEFGVSQSMVWQIASGRSWPCAPGPITYVLRGQTLSLDVRFWARVDRSAGLSACWPWTGADNGVGYGLFHVGRRADGTSHQVLAHRFAYEATVGPIPPGLFLRHKVCGNPPCCNPAHAEPGTQKQNMADMIAMDRGPRGERHYKAKLSDQSALEILRRRAAGEQGKDLALEFGISHSLVTQLCHRVIWKHLDGPSTRRKRGGRRLLRADKLALVHVAAAVSP